jgi:hypothetical protein
MTNKGYVKKINIETLEIESEKKIGKNENLTCLSILLNV